MSYFLDIPLFQDPLAEYVKVEPRHLGVGMYQHDLSEARLKRGAEEVVQECVSFMGEWGKVCCAVVVQLQFRTCGCV